MVEVDNREFCDMEMRVYDSLGALGWIGPWDYRDVEVGIVENIKID